MAKKGDLLVTIKGDASQFNKTIESSTNQVRKFNSSANRAGSSVGGFSAGMGKLVGIFGRVAGPLGIAITAISTLNKAMNATETSSDFFANNIAAAGDSVTQFFVALQTGDFSNFDKGLTDIYKRAKDAREALDQLGNTAKSLQFIKAFGNLEISDLMEDIFDSDNVKDQLNMWEKANGIAVEIKEAAEEQQKKTKTVIDTKFSTYGLPADLITPDRLYATFSLDAKVNNDQVKKEAKEGAKAYEEELKQLKKDSEYTYTKYTTVAGRTTSNKAKGFDWEKYDKGKRELQEKYADALVTDIALNKMNNDEELFPMVDAYIKSAQDINAAQKGINQLQKTEKKIIQGNYGNAGLKNTSSSNTPTIFADGSMAKAEQDLREAEKTLSELTQGTEAWYKALEKVNKLRVENDNYQNYLKDLELIKEIQDIQVMSIDELSFDQIQKNQRIITDLVGKISNKALREQFDDLLKYYSNSISEMQIRASAEMYINMMVTPTNYTTNKSDDKELKELTKELKELSRAIAIEKDPTKLSDLQSQYTSKTARMEELKAIHQRPSIFNSLNPDIRRTLGVEKDKTIDWTNPSSLQKYEDDIVDKIMLFQASYDKNHPLYQYIIDRLTAEQRIVATRNDDLIADLYNIDIKSLENQNKPKNREDLLKGRANLQRGVETTTEELDRQKHILDKLFKDFNNLSNDIEKLKTKRDLETDPDKKKEYNEQIKQLFEERDKIYKGVEQVGEDGEVTIIINGIEQQTEKIIELERHIQGILKVSDDLAGVYDLGQINIEEQMQKNVELTNQWRDALSDVGTMFYNIGAISDESTARTLSGLSSVFSGIQQMIPAIKTLTLLNQKDALAAAVKSGAALPFPANLAAIGASVAAVVAGFAQMSSIPAFADGGLVYGNTIAQVGEYAGASSNPEVIAPLSKLKNILAESGGTGGNVQFRIQGKELVGVLDNYSSIKKKR